MKKIKKNALFLLLASSLLLSGCEVSSAQENEEFESSITINDTSEINNDTSEINTSEAPRFETTYKITDWSADDFCTVQCYGIDISFPCRLSDVDKRFDIELCNASEDNIFDSDTFDLYYNNEYVGSMVYDEKNYDINNDYLNFLYLESFCIKGLTEKSTKDEVHNVLGKGNHIDDENTDAYYLDNKMIVFNYLNNQTYITIIVYEED